MNRTSKYLEVNRMNRILLVEDNKVVSKTIGSYLIKHGFHVDCVFSAEDGLIEVFTPANGKTRKMSA